MKNYPLASISIAMGRSSRIEFVVINKGYITNLPQDCCVEVPVYVDKMGLHPARIGNLPAPLAAMNQSNVTVQMLVAEAALTGDPELIVAAIAMDPLASSVLTLQEIRDLTIEMFESQEKHLSHFKGKPKKIYEVKIPEGTEGVSVPLDPALAVANRLVGLA